MSPRTVLGVILASASAAHAEPALETTTAPLQTRTSAIVGGTEVPPGRWPDTVAVLGERGACTGTLIAPDVVLTAGHCAGIVPEVIIANTVDYTSGGTTVEIERTIPYPSWANTYDVSVVLLSQSISSVAPRALGIECTFDAFEQDTEVHLVGFGATDRDGSVHNSHLREAMAAVVDPSCASSEDGCNPSVAPGGEFIAGGTGSADSCFGDSGGPVYLDTPRGPVVVGAVSRGVPGAETPCGGGGIYVRTDKIIDWIETTAGKRVTKDDCSGPLAQTDPGPFGFGCAAGAPGRSALPLALLALALVFVRRRKR